MKMIEFNFSRLLTGPIFLQSPNHPNQPIEIRKKVLDGFKREPAMDVVEESSIGYQEDQEADISFEMEPMREKPKENEEWQDQETEKEIDLNDCWRGKNIEVTKEHQEKMMRVLMNNLKMKKKP